MRPKILVIEDDADIQEVLKEHLELDGYEVFCASTGKEGERLFEEKSPDLAIVDVNLPDITGFEVCGFIRSKSDIPIIVLTVRGELEDKLKGFECGADDYVTKPFEYLELAARVRVHLKRKKRPEVIECGDVKVFTKDRKVLVGDRPVRLTKREYELLELLVLNAGKVLSRDYIKSRLWGEDELYPWSRAIDVHIKRLREKIEPDPSNPKYIITCVGKGYMFRAC